MKYLASDFYFLTSAVGLKARTVEAAYESMCTYMGYPVSMPCLLHAVRGLVAGGYIKVKPEGNVVSAATPMEVTPEGKKLAASHTELMRKSMALREKRIHDNLPELQQNVQTAMEACMNPNETPVAQTQPPTAPQN